MYENIVVILEVKAPILDGVNDDKKFSRNLSESVKQRNRTSLLIKEINKIIAADQPLKVLDYSVINHTEREVAEGFSAYRNKSDEEQRKILFKDDIENFTPFWKNEVESHLKNAVLSSNFLSHFNSLCSAVNKSNTTNFQSIVLRLWCLDNRNIQNTDRCSLGYWIN